MPLNVNDVMSSFLYAKSQVKQWEAEWLEKWLEPEHDIMILALAARIESMPGMEEELRGRNPEAWKKLIEHVKAAKARMNNGSER